MYGFRQSLPTVDRPSSGAVAGKLDVGSLRVSRSGGYVIIDRPGAPDHLLGNTAPRSNLVNAANPASRALMQADDPVDSLLEAAVKAAQLSAEAAAASAMAADSDKEQRLSASEVQRISETIEQRLRLQLERRGVATWMRTK